MGKFVRYGENKMMLSLSFYETNLPLSPTQNIPRQDQPCILAFLDRLSFGKMTFGQFSFIVLSFFLVKNGG
jgi:hypothetical protein